MRKTVLVVALVAVLGACAGGSASDLDPRLEAGREVFAANCSICHGGSGQGASAPALSEVIETFGECADQMRWITIGSDRHKEEVGPTYGDTDKEITAVMPPFGSVLSLEQIAQVAAFERHSFGGEDESVALEDCGL